MTIVRCVDFETTGLAPPDAAVCEIGWADVCSLPADKPDDPIQWAVAEPRSILVNPGHPIPPTASAVHHIVDADVDGAQLFSKVSESLLSPFTLCAHNAKFERQFFTAPATWICTYKIALYLAPNAPAHNLQTLRYWLKLDVDRAMAEPPHRAGPDAYIAAHLLVRMLSRLSIDDMVAISSRPAQLSKFTFGKHAMVPLAEIPTDYLEWITRQADMDEDVLHTARCELRKRAP